MNVLTQFPNLITVKKVIDVILIGLLKGFPHMGPLSRYSERKCVASAALTIDSGRCARCKSMSFLYIRFSPR